MKYERTAPVRIGHISELDHFVTDRAPPERIAQLCRESDVSVEVVNAT
jgi:DeoR family glycerol-3-phosphate regulon repressor